jgi:phenylacetate-CoA ligase
MTVAETNHPDMTAVRFFQVEERPDEFWESKATRPQIEGAGPDHRVTLQQLAAEFLPSCLQHPFQPLVEIRKRQFERLRDLVEQAFHEVPI